MMITKKARAPLEYLEQIEDFVPVTIQTRGNEYYKPVERLEDELLILETKYPKPVKQGVSIILPDHVPLEDLEKIEDFVPVTIQTSSNEYPKPVEQGVSIILPDPLPSEDLGKIKDTAPVNIETSSNEYPKPVEQNSIDIPVEYSKRDFQTNSNTIVSVINKNKNLLMIAGAFLVGYIIFSNSKSSN
jgi:hypothetical protein